MIPPSLYTKETCWPVKDLVLRSIEFTTTISPLQLSRCVSYQSISILQPSLQPFPKKNTKTWQHLSKRVKTTPLTSQFLWVFQSLLFKSRWFRIISKPSSTPNCLTGLTTPISLAFLTVSFNFTRLLPPPPASCVATATSPPLGHSPHGAPVHVEMGHAGQGVAMEDVVAMGNAVGRSSGGSPLSCIKLLFFVQKIWIMLCCWHVSFGMSLFSRDKEVKMCWEVQKLDIK